MRDGMKSALHCGSSLTSSANIHQPLHAGFAEDRGGTDLNVSLNDRKMNLHSLWDTGFVELERGTP